MDNRDLKRNASGYYDETPYKAMTTGPKPGDVWVRQDGANMLVVAVNGYICNTLRMNDTPKDATSFEIKHGSRSWYVNIPYIGFIRAGDLVSYEFNVGDEQLMNIKGKVGEALDLYDEEEVEEEDDDAVSNSELTDDLVKLKTEYGELEGKCEELEIALQQAIERAAKLEAYREMYENLLDKVIGRAG